MHEDDLTGSREQRYRGKPPAKRVRLSDCQQGDVVAFVDGAPAVRNGPDDVMSPGDIGLVSFRVSGSVFVRFALDRTSYTEPLEVARDERIRVVRAR